MRHWRALLFFVIATVLLILGGCGGDETTPKSGFQAYANAWKNKNFEKMYDYLSKESKQAIKKEDFVARYKRIYDGIEAGKIAIKVKSPKDEADENASFTATLETVAGPVDFSDTVTMHEETRNDEKNWYVDWKPALILPGMEGDDKISVDTLPSQRGDILDRNGEPLAMNGTAARIDIVPGKLGADKEQTIDKLSKMLGLSPDQISKALEATWVTDETLVPIKTVDAADTDLIDKATALPGVTKTDVESRVYPDGRANAHLTGYVGPITAELLKKHEGEGYHENSQIGRSGLEQIFEKQLRQQDGATIRIVDGAGAEKGVVAEKAPKDGQDIRLTIDKKVQDALYQELKQEAGTAAAIHPKTGEILGLVSTPSYDPNAFVRGISDDDYQKLSNDPKKPLTNRFTIASAPGSTFKPITAAIALNHQSLNPNEKIAINGKKWQPSDAWGDFFVTRLNSTPRVDMAQALYLSDNIYFAQAALKIGGKNFVEDGKKFGFNESLPIDIPMQQSTLSNDGKLDDEGLLANSGYGQGQVQVNPLHMSLIYSAFVNDGSIVKPRLILNDEPPEMWKKSVMSSETAQLINKDLIQVIENPGGTGRAAKIDGLPLAGKTGTPEFKSSQKENGKENGWFVVYNTEDPRLLVTMVVENTEDRGGSHNVVPKVKNVFEKVLKP